jgi:hypothetical protein
MHGAKIFAIIFMASLVLVCSKPKETETKVFKSSQTIEDLSGMAAIKQGEEMKKKLKEFEKTRQERLKEVEIKE